MSDSGWLSWAVKNKVPALGIALCLLVTSADLGVISARVGGDDSGTVTVGTTTSTTEATGDTTTTTESTVPGETTTTARRRTTTTQRVATGPTTTLPGVPPAPPCHPDPGYQATGITPTQVTIGEIVTDVPALPQQLRPNYEGLQAYVKLVNDAGGVCGRTIKIDYSNDNLNPATHDYKAMTHRVFAFVANSSLLDTLDYGGDKPFDPVAGDTSATDFVPDVGGLALSTGRNQSQWYAGNLGSLSPSLIGGGAVRTMVEEAKGLPHGPCRKAGVVYLNEPTNTSKDQADLGRAALAADWGGNFGAANVKLYSAELNQPTPVYQTTVGQMVRDGVNCVFTYADLQSEVNLVKAMANEGVWPADKCSGSKCFPLVWIPYAGYDPQFINLGGDAARNVTTFLPHVPFNETSGAALQTYLNALKAVFGDKAKPSTFSLIGYTAGMMFVQALQACGAAPTRLCVMEHLRAVKDFTADGLLAGSTPFRTTRVNCNGDCGNFTGTDNPYDWKWVFNCWVMMRVSNGDFHRTTPSSGYTCDDLHVARGTPA